MIERQILKFFEETFGKDKFTTEREDLICYAYDAMNMSYLPDAVVFPENVKDVVNVMRIANENRIPVVPRGAGSGLTGGSIPINGGIVLSFESMNRIKKIDIENLTAVVEPGVVTGELHRRVESMGLFYPPDPASLDFCTLGGNVAENAGGLRAVKYGVTKDYVLGLEVVLPDGSVVKPGLETVKGVVGYDLVRLFVGSEGTLGVVTEIILKLIPRPPAKITFLVSFNNIESALHTVTDIFRGGILPSTIEFIDKICIELINKFLNLGISSDASALLLIEDDGNLDSVRHNGVIIEKIVKENGAFNIERAESPERIQQLWKARRGISPSLARVAPYKLNEDVTVPRSRLADLLKETYRIGEKYSVKIANFGHAGDGNIHVNVLYSSAEEKERADKAVEEIMRKTVELNGTISGEHGVGLAKKQFINIELDKVRINLMKDIKKVFDPNGILNPGKIFGD
jgi:glycolate oxidase